MLVNMTIRVFMKNLVCGLSTGVTSFRVIHKCSLTIISGFSIIWMKHLVTNGVALNGSKSSRLSRALIIGVHDYHGYSAVKLLPVLPPLQITFQDKRNSMKQFIKIVNSVLLIVSLLSIVSSCSTLNIKNIEKKLITKNPGSVAISISTTYLPAKTVWYYTADSIFVFKKTLNRNQIAQDKYGLDKSLHNSLFFKELVDVEALENDIYKHCGYVLDGDELTLTLAKDSKTIQKSFFIDIDRFVSASFDHDVLNTIKSDIITYSLWPLLKEYNKVKAHEVLWVIDGIAADMYDPLLSDDIDKKWLISISYNGKLLYNPNTNDRMGIIRIGIDNFSKFYNAYPNLYKKYPNLQFDLDDFIYRFPHN